MFPFAVAGRSREDGKKDEEFGWPLPGTGTGDGDKGGAYSLESLGSPADMLFFPHRGLLVCLLW